MIIPAIWTGSEDHTKHEGPTFIYFADGVKGEKY